MEVISAGVFAALFCIPGMLVFAAAFHPQIFVNLAYSILDTLLRCPLRVWRAKKARRP